MGVEWAIVGQSPILIRLSGAPRTLLIPAVEEAAAHCPEG